MDLSSQPPATPNGLPLLRGCGRRVHFSMGVVWAFLPVFVFSEKLGAGGCQQPHWAVWSQESEQLAEPLPFRKPGLRLSPELLPVPPKERCASGQGFLLPQWQCEALEGSPFPAAPWLVGVAAV